MNEKDTLILAAWERSFEAWESGAALSPSPGDLVAYAHQVDNSIPDSYELAEVVDRLMQAGLELPEVLVALRTEVSAR